MVAMLLLTACSKSSTDDGEASVRTVLVYMAGENNLSANISDDLQEMLQAKTDQYQHCLLAYIDDADKQHLPYLVRINNGLLTDSVSVSDMGISDGDVSSADPQVMRAVLNYAFHKYPSCNNDYALVLWGHASGWTIEDSLTVKTTRSQTVTQTSSQSEKPTHARRRAYGYDSGENMDGVAAWMNIHSLATALSGGPHLRYIFADCCNFQCLETLYELRHCADYIIGSPAEIPAVGAPYVNVVPALFAVDTFYTAIVNRYYEMPLGSQRHVPMSVVKTSAMDSLALATRQVLQAMKDTLGLTPYPNTAGLINYYYSPRHIDANDFVRRYAKAEDYDVWKKAFDKAVVYKKSSEKWITNHNWDFYYNSFEVTEERYGGVSLFVPQSSGNDWKYQLYNSGIRKTAWYGAVGLQDLGW
jgi:hypothetical protein